MNRETREFITPAGHKIVFNAYLTGREAQQLKSIMLSALKMNVDDVQSGRVGLGEVPSGFLVEQEKLAMRFLLVSIDGIADNTDNDKNAVVNRLLDLPASEYDAVVKEINKIQNPTAPEKSAQPGNGTTQSAQ
ncbi:MAG TPA: hypothetical protein VKW08_00370 [Xanthobacteraceae bacterium]|nr:hypothetical protein [Xanthobacteraceae bacterium]